MQPGYSIKMVWPLARIEAVVSGYENIEPEHMFNALLKFAELSSTEMELVFRNGEYLKVLLEEQADVKKVLEKYGFSVPVETTSARHHLRELMGHGGFHHNQNIVHRSDASRRLCQKAEELAMAAHKSTWQGAHLAEVLLKSPEGYLAQVMISKSSAAPSKLEEAEILYHYGTVISPASAAGAGQKPTDPAVKVIIESLQNERESSLLLIEKGGRSGMGLIKEAAGINTRENNVLFIRLNVDALLDSEENNPGIVERILKEAARTQKILFLENLQLIFEKGGENRGVVSLEQSLAEKQVRFVCTTDEASYHKWFAKRPWRTLLHPVWLEPLPELPW